MFREPDDLGEIRLIGQLSLYSLFHRCIGAHQASILEYTSQMLKNRASSVYGHIHTKISACATASNVFHDLATHESITSISSV